MEKPRFHKVAHEAEKVLVSPDDQVITKMPERDIAFVFRSMLWQYRTILACFAVFILLALFYLSIARPVYEATARLQLNPENAQLLLEQPVINNQSRDYLFEAHVENQIHLIYSTQIARKTLDAVGLDRLQQKPSWISEFLGMLNPFAGGEPRDENAEREQAIQNLIEKVSVVRIGASQSIDILARARDAQLAADIANAFAQAYLDHVAEQRNLSIEAVRSKALDQIGGMRQELRNVQEAIEAFREKNKIGTPSELDLLAQQITELNKEMTSTQAEVYAQREIHQNNLAALRSKEFLSSPIINAESVLIRELRAKYIELSQQITEQSSRYRRTHPAQIQKYAQREEINKRLISELNRIVAEQKNLLSVAERKLQLIEKQLEEKQARREYLESAMLKLTELENRAEALKQVYQDSLVKFERNNFIESLAVPFARTTQPAEAAAERVAPKTGQTLLLAGLFGLLVGMGIAGIRSAFMTCAATGNDIEYWLRTPHLASIPLIRDGRMLIKKEQSIFMPRKPKLVEFLGLGQFWPERLPNLNDLKWPGLWKEPGSANNGLTVGSLHRIAIDAPSSSFTEALRILRASWRRSPDAKAQVILITSAVPEEGKSTIVSNLAHLEMSNGARVLLIDADTRNPNLTASLLPNAKAGLVDILNQTASLNDCIAEYNSQDQKNTKNAGKLYFLPARKNPAMLDAQDYLRNEAVGPLFEELRTHFDLILVDSAPLMPVIDTRYLMEHVDGVVLTVRWWSTSMTDVASAISKAMIPEEKLLGAVLNKVNEHFSGTRMRATWFKKYIGYEVG